MYYINYSKIIQFYLNFDELILLENKVFFLIDFNGMSTQLGLFHDLRLGTLMTWRY